MLSIHSYWEWKSTTNTPWQYIFQMSLIHLVIWHFSICIYVDSSFLKFWNSYSWLFRQIILIYRIFVAYSWNWVIGLFLEQRSCKSYIPIFEPKCKRTKEVMTFLSQNTVESLYNGHLPVKAKKKFPIFFLIKHCYLNPSITTTN